MKHEDVLSLDSRRRIFEFVKEHPGTHLREIARSLGLPLGTALYHLEYLEGGDLLVVRRDGRYKRFFAKHALGRREKDYVEAFHHGVPRRIATVLLATRKRTQRELAEAVGVSRSTLSFHLAHMVERGILDRDELWPENAYRVADREVAARILVRYREVFTGAAGEGGGDEFTHRFEELTRAIGVSLKAQEPGLARAHDRLAPERATAWGWAAE